MDVVLVLAARRRPLPQIPVERSRHRHDLADAHRLARVRVPGLGEVGPADSPSWICCDHLDGVSEDRCWSPTCTSLPYFCCASISNSPSRGLWLDGFSTYTFLPALSAENRHGRVPVVGTGDRDGVHILCFERLAEVAERGGRVAQRLLRLGGKLSQHSGVDIAAVGDASGVLVVCDGGKVSAAAAVQSGDGEVDAFVGAENLAIAFRSSGNCGGYGDSVDEGAASDH